ncbi:MAG TPA: 4'-phosphopantetheinyl transferase superfamily protein [Candidatus Egerieimonas intestinavium]|mgnify:CR=1 FL=1|uniref:4'-phosphopantetheinyl transferase superfamily protein n=1 Tax=Candidatus Egerieimonas intestinavium TaxID=2840777 RepID=A0A9D1EJD3_9FIRM|nr:4'-phosphopantetheinyl transferase superfamily protein [Candidatus Egerieimonas intestinavium]
MRKGWEDFAGEEKSGDKSLGEVKGFPAGEDEAESTPPVTVWARKLSASEAPRKGALSRLGRELLFLGVRRRFGLELREEDLSRGAYGKPFVKDRPDIQFNISHSGCWAVCALGTAPLGIDVQEHRPLHRQERLEEKILNEREREFCQRLPEEERRKFFYSRWARLEAWAKGTGRGLSGGFRRPEGTGSCQEIFLEEGVSCVLWTEVPVRAEVKFLPEHKEMKGAEE